MIPSFVGCFTARVITEPMRFKIETKDEKIDFAHRLPPTSITAFTIKGDIIIHKIVLENFEGTFPSGRF